MSMTLGTLRRVDLRSIWLNEASDFTPWLAREDNLSSLGEAIGIELELEAQEKNVGPFRADILCKDTATGHWVLIENQLGKTDHTHLGQLLTYAAGLQAVTIIWIAAEFTEEHRAALDWLNNITDPQCRLLGLEIELWQIGDSVPAPKFNVISKPNDWTKSVTEAARSLDTENLSETKLEQLEFWHQFHDYLLQEKSVIRPQRPYPQHWMNFGIGRSGFTLGALLNSMRKQIGVELSVNHDDAKAFFDLLEQQRLEIEAELGFAMEWMRLPERKASRIVCLKEDADPLDREAWSLHRAWMKDRLEALNKVLRERIRRLEVDQWNEREESEE